MFCWEFATILHRELAPALTEMDCKLLVVSIGTAARAKEFVAETGFPLEQLYADPDNQTYDRIGFYKGLARTFFNPATPLSIKARADKDGAKDLTEVMKRWKPWLPPKANQGLQQVSKQIRNYNWAKSELHCLLRDAPTPWEAGRLLGGLGSP
jgi:hypothetical protein